MLLADGRTKPIEQLEVGERIVGTERAGHYRRYVETEVRDLWSEVWVTIPFVIAILLGAIGGAYVNPREKRLAELAEGGGGGDYDRVLGQVRTATYGGMALVLVAAFFMVTKLGA